jgi:hypothetical protein
VTKAEEEVRSIDSCEWVEIHHAAKRTTLVNRIRASVCLCARPLVVLSWITLPTPETFGTVRGTEISRKGDGAAPRHSGDHSANPFGISEIDSLLPVAMPAFVQ